jgi:hypothetical protein
VTVPELCWPVPVAGVDDPVAAVLGETVVLGVPRPGGVALVVGAAVPDGEAPVVDTAPVPAEPPPLGTVPVAREGRPAAVQAEITTRRQTAAAVTPIRPAGRLAQIMADGGAAGWG